MLITYSKQYGLMRPPMNQARKAGLCVSKIASKALIRAADTLEAGTTMQESIMAAAVQIAQTTTPSEIPFDRGTEKTGHLSRAIIDADNQRPAFTPIRVTRETIEAYRKTEPLFTAFLIESGRVIVLDNQIARSSAV